MGEDVPEMGLEAIQPRPLPVPYHFLSANAVLPAPLFFCCHIISGMRDYIPLKR